MKSYFIVMWLSLCLIWDAQKNLRVYSRIEKHIFPISFHVAKTPYCLKVQNSLLADIL